MRGTVEPTSTLLSKNNLLRSSKTQPAPIRRSDSARIETWRDEVNCCCNTGNGTITPPPDLNVKEHTGRLSKVTSKVFKRRSTVSESLNNGKDGSATKMYEGNTGLERRGDDWEEGAGESMYLGSMGSADGRLERAEILLSRGWGDGEKKVQNEVKGVQQAAA